MEILNEDHQMIRDAAAGYLAQNMPTTAFRALRDAGGNLGYDAAALAEISELGWMGIVLPEAQGGADFGARAAGLIAEEIGKNLSAAPFHSTAIIAATILRNLGGEVLEVWGPKIASGKAVVALATDEGVKHRPTRITTTATPKNGGFSLTGQKAFVVDGVGADRLIVSARLDGALALFWVDPTVDGVSLTAQKMLDARGAVLVKFDAATMSKQSLLASGAVAEQILEKALQIGRAVVAAEQLGIAREVASQTVDYLQTRKQFGTVIGNFQALQHRAADLYCEIEQTASLVAAALNAIDSGADNSETLSHAAKAKAAKTGRAATEEAVQMHGGIGMTDELDLGLYMKRDRALAEFLGDRAFHTEWLLQHRGL